MAIRERVFNRDGSYTDTHFVGGTYEIAAFKDGETMDEAGYGEYKLLEATPNKLVFEDRFGLLGENLVITEHDVAYGEPVKRGDWYFMPEQFKNMNCRFIVV